MSKHTPGPWVVDKEYWSGDIPTSCVGEWDKQNRSVMAEGLSVCMVQGDTGKPMEANAKLIAAAPDMLAALKEVYQWFCSSTFTSCALIEKIENVIITAEGGE